MIHRLSILFVVVILLSGCAAQPLSLKKTASEKIDSIDQLLVIAQNNLDVTVTPGNPGNSGIIGALIVAAIDESRRSSAEKQATPIINELREYDFRSVMLDSVNSEISNSRSLRYQIRTKLETVDSESNKWINYDKSDSSAVLFTHVNYRLNSGNLIIEAKVEMFPKTESLYPYREKPNTTNLIDAGNMIYRKVFKFKKHAVSAADIRSSLDDGARNIARQIVADLSHPI